MAQPDSTSTKPPAPGRTGVPGFVILIAITVVLVLIFIFYWPKEAGQKSAPPRPKPLDTIALLERRLANDEARIGRDEARLQKLDQVASSLDLLAQRVSRLEQTQPTALASPTAPLTSQAALPNLNAYALKSDSDALAARVARLEAQNPGGAVRSAAAAMALANLVRAGEGEGNFWRELGTLSPLMPDAPEARDLARYARGVETEPVLASRFPQVAADAIAADRRAGAKGWFARLWVNLSSLVSVRRVGEVEGNDTESKLARASARLRLGDLDGAVDQVRAVSGPAQPITAPWVHEAQARVAVDHDLSALANRLVAQLSAGASK
jgi:hypothetical protein